MPSRPALGRGQRVASKESAGSQPILGRLPAQAPPPFPRCSRLFPLTPPAPPPRHFPEACSYFCEETRVEMGPVSTSGRKTHGAERLVPSFRFPVSGRVLSHF